MVRIFSRLAVSFCIYGTGPVVGFLELLYYPRHRGTDKTYESFLFSVLAREKYRFQCAKRKLITD